MLQIFLAEYRLFYRYAPVNTKTLILDVDSTIIFRMIELIAFVLEDGGLGENGKTMGEATRDEELKSD